MTTYHVVLEADPLVEVHTLDAARASKENVVECPKRSARHVARIWGPMIEEAVRFTGKMSRWISDIQFARKLK